MRKAFLTGWCFALLMQGCTDNKMRHQFVAASQDVSYVVSSMTALMIHDVTNPPLASRFYSYAMLAGYEVVAENNSSFKSMRTVIDAYPDIKKPGVKNYSYQAAAIFAMLEVASKIQPSGKSLDSSKQKVIAYFKENELSQNVIDSSTVYAHLVATQILAFAKEDGYRKISNYQRYTPLGGDAYWKSTPPAYMAAVEPYFKMVRTFYLDSAIDFKPAVPIEFSDKKGSSFYLLSDVVYKEIKSVNIEHRDIASFWDCNPFALMNEGHLQIGAKKISPVAHWIGIVGICCKERRLSFDSTIMVYTLLSTGVMDAFVSCWTEKFRSNRVRPESAIRNMIDPVWQPFLQTPPFPEYPSGHSVISSSAAEILTIFFGDSYSFIDTVEKPYGLPVRKFSSFRQAAAEAGLSRFYGGIHFMDAIEEGQKQGKKIGQYVVGKYFKKS